MSDQENNEKVLSDQEEKQCSCCEHCPTCGKPYRSRPYDYRVIPVYVPYTVPEPEPAPLRPYRIVWSSTSY